MRTNNIVSDKFGRRQKGIILIMMTVVISIIVITGSLLTMNGNRIADNEVQRYLSELSFQTSYKVNQQMQTNLNTLKNLQNQLSIVSDDEKQKIIENTAQSSAFQEIGTIDKKGRFVSERMTIDLSKTNIVNDLKNGTESISSELLKLENGQEGVVYAISNETENTVLAGFIPTDTMLLLLNTDTFKGVGFSHIVSRNGEFVLKSQNENAVLSKGKNFLDELLKLSSDYDYEKKILDMKSNLQNGKNGKIEYTVPSGDDTEERSLTYVPLDKGNWYLISIVPSDAYVLEINQFTSFAILAVTSISILLFSALAGFIYWMSIRKMSDMEYIDPVTQGFTKSRMDQEMRRLIADFSPFTYVALDIRKFKLINDVVGSDGGDRTLKYIYDCIKNVLDENEYVARLQADNFEIILQTVEKEKISEKLLIIADEINKFNQDRAIPYYLPIDCGIYIISKPVEDLVIIRDRANTARKNNKKNNENHLCSCVYYSDLERLQMVHEKEIDNNMEMALRNEEFIVYLQPKINISTNKVAGAEALIRWDSPRMGFLYPDQFIPYFEKTGFIVKLDEYVFEKVCKQIRTWIDEGKEPVPISVNLSRRDLYEDNYLTHYKEIQKKYGIEPHMLEIEFTETLFFENLELLKKSIQEVHEAGYLCSIDDFGSGYSSLSLLKEIPVDILKLDKEFFKEIKNERGDKVVEHVIALAKDLKIATIAEGVESLIQVEQLQKMKCDLIQGYVYYKPMSMDDFNLIVDHDYEIISIS